MDGDPKSGASTSESGLSAPPLDAATGYGVGLTVVEAVLLALGYYGVLAINETGEFGQAVPEPFYYLGIAILFVAELLNSSHLGAVALARVIAFAAVYGALFVLAVEGGRTSGGAGGGAVGARRRVGVRGSAGGLGAGVPRVSDDRRTRRLIRIERHLGRRSARSAT
jgi:hypothetical protein